jgi:hypothetical protein
VKHEEARDLLADYALDLLERDGLVDVAEHVDECEVCHAELRLYGQAARALASLAAREPAVLAATLDIPKPTGEVLGRIAALVHGSGNGNGRSLASVAPVESVTITGRPAQPRRRWGLFGGRPVAPAEPEAAETSGEDEFGTETFDDLAPTPPPAAVPARGRQRAGEKAISAETPPPGLDAPPVASDARSAPGQAVPSLLAEAAGPPAAIPADSPPAEVAVPSAAESTSSRSTPEPAPGAETPPALSGESASPPALAPRVPLPEVEGSRDASADPTSGDAGPGGFDAGIGVDDTAVFGGGAAGATGTLERPATEDRAGETGIAAPLEEHAGPALPAAQEQPSAHDAVPASEPDAGTLEDEDFFGDPFAPGAGDDWSAIPPSRRRRFLRPRERPPGRRTTGEYGASPAGGSPRGDAMSPGGPDAPGGPPPGPRPRLFGPRNRRRHAEDDFATDSFADLLGLPELDDTPPAPAPRPSTADPAAEHDLYDDLYELPAGEPRGRSAAAAAPAMVASPAPAPEVRKSGRGWVFATLMFALIAGILVAGGVAGFFVLVDYRNQATDLESKQPFLALQIGFTGENDIQGIAYLESPGYTRGFLRLDNLPIPDKGRAYVLWAEGENGVQMIREVRVTRDERLYLDLSRLPKNLSRLFFTEEQQGFRGNQPTGRVVATGVPPFVP